MARIHINPDTEKVGACSAKIKCRFQQSDGEEIQHFGSHEEAYQHLEKRYAAKPGSWASQPLREEDAKLSFEDKAFLSVIAVIPVLSGVTAILSPPLGLFLAATSTLVGAPVAAKVMMEQRKKEASFAEAKAKREAYVAAARRSFLSSSPS